MKNIEELKEKEIHENKKILLFSTEWCGDCITLRMYIDEVIEENKNWEFIYVDSEKNMELAKHFNILGIPSFVALEDGIKVGELISKDPKPKSLINNWIKSIGLINV